GRGSLDAAQGRRQVAPGFSAPTALAARLTDRAAPRAEQLSPLLDKWTAADRARGAARLARGRSFGGGRLTLPGLPGTSLGDGVKRSCPRLQRSSPTFYPKPNARGMARERKPAAMRLLHCESDRRGSVSGSRPRRLDHQRILGEHVGLQVNGRLALVPAQGSG